MADAHQKQAIQTAIQAFAARPLHDAATVLGYSDVDRSHAPAWECLLSSLNWSPGW